MHLRIKYSYGGVNSHIQGTSPTEITLTDYYRRYRWSLFMPCQMSLIAALGTIGWHYGVLQLRAEEVLEALPFCRRARIYHRR